MRKYRYCVMRLTVCLLFVLMVSPLWAVGSWTGGTLTAPPWQENGHLQVLIDGVRYTVMSEVDVQVVTSKNGETRKDPVTVQQLRAGDALTVQHSGNRIYAIEINR